jgi:hypothetical protein
MLKATPNVSSVSKSIGAAGPKKMTSKIKAAGMNKSESRAMKSNFGGTSKLSTAKIAKGPLKAIRSISKMPAKI